MTVIDIALDNLLHPLQRFENASVLNDYIAVVMPPANIVGPVIKLSHLQLLDMKEIKLRYSQIENLSPCCLLQAPRESKA